MIRARAMLLIAGLAIGCDKPSPPAAALPAPTFGNATITGRIRFVGTPPERKMVDLSTCEHPNKVYQEETIVVGEGGGLKDAVVYLKDAPTSDGSARPQAVLDQIACRYVPHVVAVQVGQPLKITTSDLFFHNVHWNADANGDVNLGMRQPSDAQVKTFAAPEFLRVRCDVHPWMNGIISVLPNPFFAVSETDGRFKVDRVPAGHYTLAAWHPILGERTAAVDVAADGTVDQSIDFAPPK